MRTLRAWIFRVASLFNRRKKDWEMEQEFQSHLQMELEDKMRSGMTPEEARRAAMIKSGGLSSARESHREQRGLPFLETLLQDIRYGIRNLRKSPGFTIAAVAMLALGIGANTAMFSVVNAVLLCQLPYREADRLVQLWETEPAPGVFPFAGPDYLDWQAQNKTLESSSLSYDYAYFNLSRTGDSQVTRAMATQANFFATLGVPMLRGRSFAAGEDQKGKDHVAILTYPLWQSFFGGREDVLNNAVELDGEKYTVVGILPKWYRFSSVGLYVPLDMGPKGMGQRGNHSFHAIARLKPGVTVEAAQADLMIIAKRLEQQYPDSNKQVEARVIPLHEQISGDVRPRLLVLLGAVALVLLVACANLANLLLARSTGRQREIALRSVLGASRIRIIRQLLTESLLLSLTGASLGLLGAYWCARLIESARTLPIPRQSPVQIDLNVLLFTIGAGLFVGLLFGLAPALQATRGKLADELKSGAQSVLSPSGWSRKLRDALVIVEIALSLSLLAGAGLLIKSFARMSHADIGVDPENLLTFSVYLPHASYPTTVSQRTFTERFLSQLQALPGVKSATFSSAIPLESGSNGPIKVDGDTNPAHNSVLVEQNLITPDYFRTYGIPFLQGANFTPADLEHAWQMNEKLQELSKTDPEFKHIPPDVSFDAVISRATAETFWPGQNPVGKIYHWGNFPVRVLGVVGDVNEWGVRLPPHPQAYYPLTFAFNPAGFGSSVAIKTSGDPRALLPAVRATLRSVDSSLGVYQARTMEQVIANDVEDAGVQTMLLGSFAGLALLLACTGLYSVLSYLVTQRTREIGIRMALGAQRGHVLRLVMRHAALLTAAGLGVGLLIALIGTRLVKSMLFQVSAYDPATFVAVVSGLAAIALLAALIPVRRATKVDPMVALRYE
ncbi:MAG TPA: ABC transporter permease [Candidatus Angelobacter sp.]|nr:ABC transporter permease [Candidatus Angelobacter sp.]